MKHSKDDLIDEIKRLKKRRQAVILAHNYQLPEIQDIADFTGDSLGLSRQAAETKAKVIVFCGVDFMAQTAAILSPHKKVIMPVSSAGCALAEMITVSKLKKMKKKHPKAKVVCYVNTSASIKAESDICCTSSNSVKVVNSLPKDKEIIFIPDENLCNYTSKETKRELICWRGYCPVHKNILLKDIKSILKKYPKAKVMVHPECTPAVVNLADAVVSTSGMLKYAKKSKDKEFIVSTEVDMLHRLKKENPNKRFFPASIKAVCPTMKLITLDKLLSSLENLSYEVKVPADIIKKAKRGIEKMLALA